MKNQQQINFGCQWASDEMVIIQLSEQLQDAEEIAQALQLLLKKENIKREYHGKRKIAYKIATTENLKEQFPDVASGNFKFSEDANIKQRIAGCILFGRKV